MIAIGDLLDVTSSSEQASPISLSRGKVPVPYRESHVLAGSPSIAFLDVGDRDLVLGFTGSPFLLRTDHEGTVADTTWIGEGSRRGQLDEEKLLEAMRDNQPESQQESRSWLFDFFSSVSMFRGLSRDDAGNVYTLHQDSEFDERGTMAGVKLYVAVSRLDGGRGCADTLVPASEVGAPIPFLRGRTLWILDRRLRGSAATNIATVVRRFTLDPDHCTGTVR